MKRFNGTTWAGVSAATVALCLVGSAAVAPGAGQDRFQEERRGEVWDGASGRWILRETADARHRRADLVEGIERLLETQPETGAAPPTLGESEILLRWEACLVTKHMRLCATRGDARAADYARCAERAVELFAFVFGQIPILEGGMTVYVIDRETDEQAFLRSHPSLKAAEVGPLDSFWIPRSPKLVIWNGSHRDRIDQVARHVLQRMLAESFGLEPGCGWAFEGMGTLLTVFLTGRHGASMPLEASVQGDAAEIWKQAREALASEELDLESVLRKPRGEMSRSDILVSYAFCRYLVEGHANDASTVLRFLGDGLPPETVFEDVLGFDLAELQPRLVRWVQEEDGEVGVLLGLRNDVEASRWSR